ncbi:MAG TPA: phosphopantothenoylcysteine decarboxylase, partial [Cellvibrio sp.]|nr:phosphopantothenoylcysteine decarboxylase [Cellvibrio sp.]
ENLLAYARTKRQQKNLDLIIANNIAIEGIGFDSDDNAVTLIDHNGEQVLTQRSKQQLARDLIALLADRLPAQQ